MDKIIFKYEYRPYQHRIINELEKYLQDGKVHIVAAPGSGKTIVALKLMFDLNAKALILVPTIPIREQWVSRILNDFKGVTSDEVSTSLRNVKSYTIITYQALYEYKPADIKQIVNDNNIKTFVFDEAHHLRNAWFNHISKFIDEIEDAKTISLTATPPYDDAKLYKNYISLCGEIDTEVEAPELVLNRNLCPHQDFLYFNSITEEEEKEISNYRNVAIAMAKALANEELFIKAVATHRFFLNTKENATEILSNENIFCTMTRLLMRNGIDLSKDVKSLGIKDSAISIHDLEELFEYALINKDEDFKIISKLCDKYRSAFTKIGAIEKGSINLLYSNKISKNLSENIGKLDSVNEIILHEKQSVGDELKLIIVSDYIKNYKTIDEEDVDDIADVQIGVIPIFNNIKNKIGDKVKAIVLTGSIILVPAEYKDLLVRICSDENIPNDKVSIKEFDIDFNYLEVKFSSNDKSVKVITKLFHESNTSVLVGTTALIGEGWDAPFVNTLIIASNVSSYITSNQIRGRVIRIDKENRNKVSNIWHLVTLEKSNGKYYGGQDYEKIATRLGHIEGLCISKPEIRKGFQRFEEEVSYGIESKDCDNELNSFMKDASKDRDKTSQGWKKALVLYEKSDLVPVSNFIERSSIMKKLKPYDKPTTLTRASRAAIAFGLTAGILYFGGQFLTLETFLLSLVGVSCLDSYLINEGAINKSKWQSTSLNKLLVVILISLKEKKVVNKDVSVKFIKRDNVMYISFENADIREQSIIKKCIEEAISDKHDTRYMIKVDNFTYNVPSIFDKTKESAERFFKYVKENNHMRKCSLIYSKGSSGKLERLKLLCNSSNDENEDNEVDLEMSKADIDVLNALFNSPIL